MFNVNFAGAVCLGFVELLADKPTGYSSGARFMRGVPTPLVLC